MEIGKYYLIEKGEIFSFTKECRSLAGCIVKVLKKNIQGTAPVYFELSRLQIVLQLNMKSSIKTGDTVWAWRTGLECKEIDYGLCQQE